MTGKKVKKKRAHVFIVSDASGFTAERVIHTILVQFKQQLNPVVRRRSFVREVEQLQKVLEEASAVRAVVIYSLVCAELRQYIALVADSMNIMCIDLLGPLIEKHLGPLPGHAGHATRPAPAPECGIL